MIEKEQIIQPREMDFLQDTEFLLSRHKINKKIENLLTQSEERLRTMISERELHFPDEVLSHAGKISKGENYKLLPYLILDFPRYFKKEDVFAFRTMFWWGNFFSCTLHLQGRHLVKFRREISKNYANLINSGTYISISKTPWEYDYTDHTYQLIDHWSEHAFLQHLEKSSFIKLSRRIDLSQYAQLPDFCGNTFLLFSKAIGIKR